VVHSSIEIFKQSFTGAQEDRYNGEEQLINRSGPQELMDRGDTASDDDA
jgi:hypothetical protein